MKKIVFASMVLFFASCVLGQKKHCPKKLLCGTNGITYKSRCELTEARYDDPDIEIQFEGSCIEYRKRQRQLEMDKIREESQNKY